MALTSAADVQLKPDIELIGAGQDGALAQCPALFLKHEDQSVSMCMLRSIDIRVEVNLATACVSIEAEWVQNVKQGVS